MQLIMKTEFDNLRLNPKHEYEVNNQGGKRAVKIYLNGNLIAKKISVKRSTRYFGVKNYTDYITYE